MRITVLFFATLRDRIGTRQLTLELDSAANSIERLRQLIDRTLSGCI